MISGKLGHLLDFVVPGLLVHFGNVVGVFDKARRLHDFHGIDRGGKNDGDERVRIQRDGRRQLLQFGAAALGGGRRRSCGRGGDSGATAEIVAAPRSEACSGGWQNRPG